MLEKMKKVSTVAVKGLFINSPFFVADRCFFTSIMLKFKCPLHKIDLIATSVQYTEVINWEEKQYAVD